MQSRAFHRLLLIPVLAASLWVAQAEPGPDAPGPRRKNFSYGPNESPMSFFRSLLSMSPEEREKTLKSRSPEHQKFLIAKIKEYEALKPEERELRLRTTQLHWYLTRLMRVDTTNRLEQLEKIAAPDRVVIEERLRKWDELPAATRKELLDNERVIRWVLRSTPEERASTLTNSPPTHRERLEASLRRWQERPAAERQRMCDQFNQFFELGEKEKTKTLHTLPESNRAQMEKQLQSFEKLAPDQRRKCIDSFRKFSRMSPAERTEFLANAQRWSALSPAERETWRGLVEQTPPLPPLPDGLRRFPPLPAPLLLRTNASE